MYFASHKYHLIVIFPLICGLVFSDSVVFSCDVKMLVRVTVSVSVQYGLVHPQQHFVDISTNMGFCHSFNSGKATARGRQQLNAYCN